MDFGFISRYLLLKLIVVFSFLVIASCSISSERTSISNDDPVEYSEATRGTAVGNPAPYFDLERVGTGNISLNDVKGRPAVIVFWTAWCPTCKEEAPEVNKLAAQFEAKGVYVIGINIGESPARVAEGIKDFGIAYSVVRDKDSSVARSYGVVGTPTVIFLDKAGTIQYFGNEIPHDSEERINKLIAG